MNTKTESQTLQFAFYLNLIYNIVNFKIIIDQLNSKGNNAK